MRQSDSRLASLLEVAADGADGARAPNERQEQHRAERRDAELHHGKKSVPSNREDGYFGDCIHWTSQALRKKNFSAFDGRFMSFVSQLCFYFLRRFSPSLGVKPPGSSRGSHRSPQLSAAQQRLTSRSTPCGSPGPTSQFRLLAFLAKNGLGLTTLGHAPRALPGRLEGLGR